MSTSTPAQNTHTNSHALLIPRTELSLAEFEAITGVARSTLYRMIRRGQLRTVQRGRRRLVPVSEVTAAKARTEPEPTYVEVAGLDRKAWNLWYEYRMGMNAPFKSAHALRASKARLASFGERQTNAVIRSMAFGSRTLMTE
jgi:excisionase family DNA binding protein